MLFSLCHPFLGGLLGIYFFLDSLSKSKMRMSSVGGGGFCLIQFFFWGGFLCSVSFVVGLVVLFLFFF